MSSSSPALEMVFVSRPTGLPDASNFKMQEISSPPTSAPANSLLLSLQYLSVDPFVRGALMRTLAPVNSVLSTHGVAVVVESKLSQFAKGDPVIGIMKWQTIQVHSGQGLRKINTSLSIPPSAYLGVLGLPGRAAYFGLLDHEVGRMSPGKVVLVSGAAGATGSVVGQLAKLKGAKLVIGTAGGKEKCRIVKEKYGFDHCFDYKELDTVEKMMAAIKSVCSGIDLYFDNTGGHVTTAAFNCVNKFARIALSGIISVYNEVSMQKTLVPNVFTNCIYTSVNIRGFVVWDYDDREDEFYAEMTQLVLSRKIRYDETLYQGLESLPEALAGLFTGHNTGKVVIKIGDNTGA